MHILNLTLLTLSKSLKMPRLPSTKISTTSLRNVFVHSMQHYIASILAHGSADGYSTESPERLHINFAKSAYRATNKKNYIIQMTKWLTHQEACSHFTAYLQWAVPGYCSHLQAVSELKEDDDGDDDNNKDGDGDGEEMERSRVLA